MSHRPEAADWLLDMIDRDINNAVAHGITKGELRLIMNKRTLPEFVVMQKELSMTGIDPFRYNGVAVEIDDGRKDGAIDVVGPQNTDWRA